MIFFFAVVHEFPQHRFCEVPIFSLNQRERKQPMNKAVTASSGCLETLSHKNDEKQEDEWFSTDRWKKSIGIGGFGHFLTIKHDRCPIHVHLGRSKERILPLLDTQVRMLAV